MKHGSTAPEGGAELPAPHELRVLGKSEQATGLAVPGVRGWTTTVENGSFGLGSDEPVADVVNRWTRLQSDLRLLGAHRLASGHQVHRTVVATHARGWTGWLRQEGVDGHVSDVIGTALAVTVADCTPVFIAHPKAIGLLHAGWRGAAAHIITQGMTAMEALGAPADECAVHLGPSICGACYEVGPEVLEAITGKLASGKGHLDVRAVLAQQAHALGVHAVDVSDACTRCGGGRFYSHRAGNSGRQLGVIALLGTSAEHPA